MALPKSLVNNANANVSQALQTGARGQTTTTTDYGVIGDAFFKKAQLDLQIADLHADMGYKKASLLSGLEMQRAGLELEKGKLTLNAAQMAEEQRRYEESQEVSDSERLLGSLGGAVQGAVAGFTVGGPMGAVIGAGAGGLMTYGAYGQNRQAGQQAQQTLGVIAGGAMTLKGLHDQSVQQDSWKGIMKTGGDLIAQYNAAQTPQEQYQAQQALDSHIGEVYQTAMSMPGANPEKVGTMVANYRKGLEASVGLPTNEAMKQNHFRQMENMVQYQSDPRMNDPKQQRAWANDFIKDSSAIYEETTGKQMPMSMGMRYAKQMSAQAGRVLEQQFSGGQGAYGSMPARTNTGGQAPSPSASVQAPGGTVTPNRGTPTVAPTPEQSMPVPFSGGGVPWRPMRPSGPGIEMDDGGSSDYTPVASEQSLAAQGGETVKALSQPSGQEKMGMLDKIKHNLSLDESEYNEKKIGIFDDVDKNGRTMTDRTNWVESVRQDPELGEEAVPFFSETDPRKIQDAYDVKNLHLEENDRSKVAGATSAAAQLNHLRDNLEKLWDTDIDRDIMYDYQIWKQGSIGEDGMKATSVGASGAGIGGQWSTFEKSVRQSLEGKGIKGKAADQQIQLLRKIDSQIDPIAQSMAVAKQGSRPSDADVQAYKGQLANLMDPNPDNSIVGLMELQRITYSDFMSATSLMPSRETFINRKREEGAAGRMTVEEAQARKRKTGGRYVNDFFPL